MFSVLLRCLQTTLWKVHFGILILCSNHSSTRPVMHMTHFSWQVRDALLITFTTILDKNSLPADVLWGSFITHSFLPHGRLLNRADFYVLDCLNKPISGLLLCHDQPITHRDISDVSGCHWYSQVNYLFARLSST